MRTVEMHGEPASTVFFAKGARDRQCVRRVPTTGARRGGATSVELRFRIAVPVLSCSALGRHGCRLGAPECVSTRQDRGGGARAKVYLSQLLRATLKFLAAEPSDGDVRFIGDLLPNRLICLHENNVDFVCSYVIFRQKRSRSRRFRGGRWLLYNIAYTATRAMVLYFNTVYNGPHVQNLNP